MSIGVAGGSPLIYSRAPRESSEPKSRPARGNDNDGTRILNGDLTEKAG
jgi:hypothetical protein